MYFIAYNCACLIHPPSIVVTIQKIILKYYLINRNLQKISQLMQVPACLYTLFFLGIVIFTIAWFKTH